MKKLTKILCVVLTVALAATLLVGCGPKANANAQSEVPLVVGYSPFSEKFSPFFATTGYDQDVSAMTSVTPLTTDRTGGIIYNAINGETVSYNGTDYTYTGIADIKVDIDEAADTTTYTITLRKDVKFSDGKKLTADDIIFTYYVLADPSYDGSSSIYSYNIQGMTNYRTQTTPEIFEKYSAYAAAILEKGADYVPVEADGFTAEMVAWFWTDGIKLGWTDCVKDIVDYCFANYGTQAYVDAYFNPAYTVADIDKSSGMKVAFGMAMWGFGGFEGDAFSDGTNTWTLADEENMPTLEDYYNATFAAYEGSDEAFAARELAGDLAPRDYAKEEFTKFFGPKDPSLGEGGIPNISGITKVDNYTVKVVTDGFSAPAIYSICGIEVAPLHYYGDTSKYNYNKNQFGFDYGDLSTVRAKNATPLGAGAYKFVKYEDKVVYFEANNYYYKGAPITTYIQFKETLDSDMIAGITTGTVDAGEVSLTTARVNEVKSYNSNGTIKGNVIELSMVDNLGYGYLGICASTVNVDGKADSDASKNLRKAFATMFSVYRDVAIDSYYGERASVINYPISNTSWAAPQATDEDYAVAFSKDVDGNPIYTADMDADAKYAAALNAAIGFFKAAGYTWDEATGKFTAAPKGAKMEYEALIPGDGIGDHPNFMVLQESKNALATIGISLVINDLSNSNILWNRLDANTAEIWTAAWGATIDPDMYQVYYSTNAVGMGGTDSNHYRIADEELDQLIMDARKSADIAYRKTAYKACLDIVMDWAVEVPSYQRQNCIIFSAERVKMDTLTPDITTFWGWMREVETLEVNVG